MPAVIRRLGVINFNGATDGDGTRWGCEELTGWYDGPPMRQQTMSTVGEWGAVLTENQYDARRMVLRGWALPGPGVTTSQVADKLNNVTDVTQGSNVLYVDETPAKQVTVKRDGDLRSRLMDGHTRAVEFEVPLIAPDPRKYGQTLKEETVTIDGGGTDKTSVMTVVNVGNTQAYPESIRVWGQSTGVPIRLMRTDTGQEILLEQQPVSTNEYTLYPPSKDVWYGVPGSQTRRNELQGTGTQWWKLRADGAGTSIRLRRPNADAGALRATVFFRDAWI